MFARLKQLIKEEKQPEEGESTDVELGTPHQQPQVDENRHLQPTTGPKPRRGDFIGQQRRNKRRPDSTESIRSHLGASSDIMPVERLGLLPTISFYEFGDYEQYRLAERKMKGCIRRSRLSPRIATVRTLAAGESAAPQVIHPADKRRSQQWLSQVNPLLLEARLVNNRFGTFNIAPPRHFSIVKMMITEGFFNYLITLPWMVLALLALLYFTIANLIFGALYLIDVGPGGIGNTEAGSYRDAFFFSIQTMNTIGYGFFYPISLYVNIVTYFQAFIGMITYAVLTSILLAKMMESARLGLMFEFSKQVVINNVEYTYDQKTNTYRQMGDLCLVFQLYYVRGLNVFSPNVRLLVARKVRWYAGPPKYHLSEISFEMQRRFGKLRSTPTQPPALPIPWQVVHRIDQDSPFAKIDFGPNSFELIIVVEANDDITGKRFQRAFSYTFENIEWDQVFVDPLCVNSEGLYQTDVRMLSRTSASEPGSISGSPQPTETVPVSSPP